MERAAWHATCADRRVPFWERLQEKEDQVTVERALITGITGFVGSHLAEYILSVHPAVEVYGTARWRSRRDNIEGVASRVQLIECDMNDAASVRTMIEQVRPDRVFHLAAQSFVPTSWHAPVDTLTTNVMGELNLFEAIRQVGITPTIQIAGSSEEYGKVLPDEVPIRETNPLRPLSPYAVSKVAQDMLGWQYFYCHGLRIVRTRAFNHSGPRRGDVFVESNFARQVAEIEQGIIPPVLKVGNLEARRDYTDVRDVVRAYWLAVEKGEPGEVYNIASGRSWKIREVLEMLVAQSSVEIRIEQDPARLRPSDVLILEGDYSRFRAATGWEPRISFERSLTDLLEYWRAVTGARNALGAVEEVGR